MAACRASVDWLVAVLLVAATWPALAHARPPGESPLLYGLLAGAGLLLLACRVCARSGPLRPVPGAAAALALLALLVASYVLHGCPPAGREIVLRQAGSVILFLVVAVGLRPGGSTSEPAFWGLLAVALGCAWAVGEAEIREALGPGWTLVRSPWLLIPQALGLPLTLAAALALPRAVFEPAPTRRLVLALLGALLLGCLALAGVRAAWLALGTGLAVLGLLRGRRVVVVAGVGLVLLGLLLAAQPRLAGRGPVSASLRLHAWAVAGTTLARSWALGIGPGRFPYVFAAGEDRPADEAWLSPHSAWLDLGLSCGIGGMAAWGWLLWSVGAGCARRASRPLAQACFAAVVTVAVFGLFHDEQNWYSPLMLTVWGLLGLASAEAAQDPPEYSASTSPAN